MIGGGNKTIFMVPLSLVARVIVVDRGYYGDEKTCQWRGAKAHNKDQSSRMRQM